jgi:hypothetical protein
VLESPYRDFVEVCEAAVDPDAVAAARESGWGKLPTPEVMGPALLHNGEFGKSWS